MLCAGTRVKPMRRTLVALLAVLCAALHAHAKLPSYLPGNPVANPAAVLQPTPNTRFTVLSDALVRMEYVPAGAAQSFVDAQTQVFWNRRTERVPHFESHTDGTRLTIRTAALVLTYDWSAAPGGAFTDASLQVQLLLPSVNDPAGSGAVTWTPSADPSADNLGGTFHTLDGLDGPYPLNCTYDNQQWDNVGFGSEPLTHCNWGLISKAGWSLVDDSRSPLLVSTPYPVASGSAPYSVPWFAPNPSGVCAAAGSGARVPCFHDVAHNPNDTATCAAAGCCFDAAAPSWPQCYQMSGNSDWYLFAFGWDYRRAVKEFTTFAGRVPVPRRHWTGVSWSKWGNEWSQPLAIEQVQNLTAAGFPLSTFVIDMQWHVKPQWGAYTWDSQMFPDPQALMSWMHAQGLQFGMNIHDANGVASYETYYKQMALANGIDPASGQTVAFDISSLQYTGTLQDIVMAPLNTMGNDFWWSDYQGETLGVPQCTGCNPTFVLNHYRIVNQTAKELGGDSDRRGLTHSRWGGLGNHRYVTGFGGDVRQSWPSLAFMAYFTATASNVLFQWGHEMMTLDPTEGCLELFARVVQFGSFSPAFTCWGNDGEPNDLWSMPADVQNSLRRVLTQRAMLVPYTYTHARAAHDTGLIVTRPLYYHWPKEALSYDVAAQSQYMFGDEFFVSPVLQAGGNVTVSFPPAADDRHPDGAARWIAWESPDEQYDGSTVAQLTYALDRFPAFVRTGALIPTLPQSVALVTGSASQQYHALEWLLYAPHNATNAAHSLYEDDGDSNDYLESPGQQLWAETQALYRRHRFEVHTRGSAYRGMQRVGRAYQLRVLAVAAAPTSITATANGQPQSLQQVQCPQTPPTTVLAPGTYCVFPTASMGTSSGAAPSGSSTSLLIAAPLTNVMFGSSPDLTVDLHF